MIGNALLMVLVNRMDILVLSAAAGATATGLYSLAKRIVRTVTDLIVSGLVNVSLSTLSTLKNDPENRNLFLREKIRITALISYPVFLLLAVLASHLISLLLGQSWAGSVPIVQMLCLFGIVNLPILYGTNVLVSVGYSKTLFLFNAIGTLLLFFMMSFAIKWSGVGIAASFALHSLISLLAMALILKLRLGINLKDYVMPIVGPSLCSLLMVAGAYFCLKNSFFDNDFLNILFSTFSSVIVYLFLAVLFYREDVMAVKTVFKAKVVGKR